MEASSLVRVLTKDNLKLQGYRILEAPDALQVFQICEDPGKEIDLIITDLETFPLTELEFIEKVVKLKPGVPLLCMSGGNVDPYLVEHLVRLGVGFIAKPFSPQKLQNTIKEIFRFRFSETWHKKGNRGLADSDTEHA